MHISYIYSSIDIMHIRGINRIKDHVPVANPSKFSMVGIPTTAVRVVRGVAVRLGSLGLLGRLDVLGRSSVSAGGGGAQLRAPPVVPTLHVQVNMVVITKFSSHSHSCSDRIAVKSQYTFYTKPCSAHSLSKHKTLPPLLGSARPGTRNFTRSSVLRDQE
eukprot:SAG22_NODE_49_length_24620_cov_80.053587_10_plen_160_part_00